MSVVVGTAGHIDHGKTSLVRALTGVDLDDLREEKERGITIALGFAPMALPDGRRVAFVDVPGHERLVRTMVAGATGIDAVLLCVSAAEGVMPQTREHLAILELLGIRQGAVVLTMADLVDAEMLELATDDVQSAIRGTFLAKAPVVPFSSITGDGRDRLLDILAGFTPVARPSESGFRMPVDRTFSKPGFGTVVTGTAWAGEIHDGDEVTLWPGGGTARIRGIQVHETSVSSASAGSRVALNLAGVERDDLEKGTIVASGPIAMSSILDVRYTQLRDAGDLPDDVPIRLLHGTAERLGRLHIAEPREIVAAGATVWAQLRLDAPLPCWPGDRFVLRRPSPQQTLGGGVIVDPWAPRLRLRDRDRWPAQLQRLHGGERVVWLERAGEDGLLPAARHDRRITAGVALGERVYAPTVVSRLEGALLDALSAYHAENPLSLGPQRRELRRERLAHLPDKTFDALVEQLVKAGAVEVDGPVLRIRGFAVALTPSQQALRDRVRSSFEAAALTGLVPKALHERHSEPEVAQIVKLLDDAGHIVAVPDLGWVAAEAIEDLENRIRGWFATHAELTPGDFKELTGLSRKAAIPWLEWLDKSRLTRRVGDARARGPRD